MPTFTPEDDEQGVSSSSLWGPDGAPWCRFTGGSLYCVNDPCMNPNCKHPRHMPGDILYVRDKSSNTNRQEPDRNTNPTDG